MLAPLIVFAYNRPDHLKKTLTALSNNKEAKESELFIFIDGPKNEKGIQKNKEVFDVANTFSNGYFKSVEIHNAEKNKGLAKSVIEGVSNIIDRYGRVIITEDDAVCSPQYLDFMNKSLDFFEKDKDIWSIGGYTIPMNFSDDYKHDVILTQRSSSYAWATWKDRWEKIDWDCKDYKKFHFDFINRKKFNKWGKDRASMLDDQINGRVNSWAIRFDYAMFKNNAYNILPKYSLIQNIGHDGSGTHSITDTSVNDPFHIDRFLNENFTISKPEIDESIRKQFIKPFDEGNLSLIKRYISNLFWRRK